MIVNVGYIKKLEKKIKQFFFLLGHEPTINYYKVESKFYFLDEKNILLQLACGHHPHFNVQAIVFVLMTKLEARRALHHILYVLLGKTRSNIFTWLNFF
jgi:hypothetical protein